MTTTKDKANAVYVEWKDPQKELPEPNSYALAAFSWSGCKEDYEILFFDGKYWHDNYGRTSQDSLKIGLKKSNNESLKKTNYINQ